MTARSLFCLLAALAFWFLSAAFSLHTFFFPGMILLCLFGTELLVVLSARLTLRASQRFPVGEAGRGETVPLCLNLVMHAVLPAAHPEAEVILPDGKPAWYILRASHWGRSDVAIPCVFPHVGRYEARIRQLILSDAAGLFRFRVRLRDTAPSVLILPNPVKWNVPALPDSLRPGAPADPERDEPDRIRGFQPGDSLSRVHWKLSARHGDLVIRTPERRRDADLLVAFSAGGLSPEAFDVLSEACFSFLCSDAAREGRLRLLLPQGQALDLPMVTEADLPLPRRLLASAAGGKSLTLTELLSQAASAVRLPDAVAVFSSRLSPRDADLLHRLRSDGVEVSLTMLPGSPEDFDAALLERLRLSGADVRTVTPEGVIS